mmetsp:Transcript_34425/g.67874  ORF Transcript_34425/g.67874 Transcript_34425/m.67874 type:complete len:389 (-) Transcript_34425:779-1945(-)
MGLLRCWRACCVGCCCCCGVGIYFTQVMSGSLRPGDTFTRPSCSAARSNSVNRVKGVLASCSRGNLLRMLLAISEAGMGSLAPPQAFKTSSSIRRVSALPTREGDLGSCSVPLRSAALRSSSSLSPLSSASDARGPILYTSSTSEANSANGSRFSPPGSPSAVASSSSFSAVIVFLSSAFSSMGCSLGASANLPLISSTVTRISSFLRWRLHQPSCSPLRNKSPNLPNLVRDAWKREFCCRTRSATSEAFIGICRFSSWSILNAPARIRKASSSENCSLPLPLPTGPFWLSRGDSATATVFRFLVFRDSQTSVNGGLASPSGTSPRSAVCTHFRYAEETVSRSASASSGCSSTCCFHKATTFWKKDCSTGASSSSSPASAIEAMEAAD